MILEIDLDDRTPPYRQIRDRIDDLIVTGALAEGTRLPPVRQLASDLELAANTVARAYRELEQDGLIVTRGRRGTFVAAPPPAAPVQGSHGTDAAELGAAARAFAASARRLGADHRSAILAVNEALRVSIGRHPR
jgi:GntR family transcriptional regulator